MYAAAAAAAEAALVRPQPSMNRLGEVQCARGFSSIGGHWIPPFAVAAEARWVR
jgi:hypothetical protein